MKTFTESILVVMSLLLISSLGYASDQGKIAVAAEGKTVTAKVSQLAGRSPCFLIFNGEGAWIEAVDNPHQGDRRGAGASVVSFLAEKGVAFVVAGEFGKKMSQAMDGRGIGYLEFNGSAEAAVKKVLEERIQK
jgi:predicted Fe-Mo cluster-binding NifX family protein